MQGFLHWLASRAPFLFSALVFLGVAYWLIDHLEGQQAGQHFGPWFGAALNKWIIAVLLACGAGAIAASFLKKVSGQIAMVATVLLLALAALAMMLVTPSGWLLVVGFFLNLGVIWSFLAVRSVVRRRRLEVVVYLADFLLDAKD